MILGWRYVSAYVTYQKECVCEVCVGCVCEVYGRCVCEVCVRCMGGICEVCV